MPPEWSAEGGNADDSDRPTNPLPPITKANTDLGNRKEERELQEGKHIEEDVRGQPIGLELQETQAHNWECVSELPSGCKEPTTIP